MEKLKTISLHGTILGDKTVPSEINGQCIAMYVRRADKGSEMKLLNFSKYSDAVERLWDGGYMRNTSIFADDKSGRRREKPVIFIGTESNDVLKEALQWGKKEGFKVKIIKSLFLSFFLYFTMTSSFFSSIRSYCSGLTFCCTQS